MGIYSYKFSIGPLTAAIANGIALSQSGTANTNLTLNGSLVSGGIATMDVARRVIVTSAGNDSSVKFTIVGTDRNGYPQIEILTGTNARAAQTVRDFLAVTSITPSANTASTVTAGTNGVASTAPWVVDSLAPNAQYNGQLTITGTINVTCELALESFAPNYDLTVNVPIWYPAVNFTGLALNTAGIIQGPVELMRLTQNSFTFSSGTPATASLKVLAPMQFGPF